MIKEKNKYASIDQIFSADLVFQIVNRSNLIIKIVSEGQNSWFYILELILKRL